jgi:hypothetical protein
MRSGATIPQLAVELGSGDAAPRQASWLGSLNGSLERIGLGALQMLDLVLLALGLGFFALSIAYAFGCDRL